MYVLFRSSYKGKYVYAKLIGSCKNVVWDSLCLLTLRQPTHTLLRFADFCHNMAPRTWETFYMKDRSRSIFYVLKVEAIESIRDRQFQVDNDNKSRISGFCVCS